MATINKIQIDEVDYDIVGKELTKITYAELKALRDNGQLSEGHFYRIIDYVTTTTQTETKSAGNVFDVIVLAVSENELSHIARAIQHEGDTYFDGNDLSAWELWYDLDNDTNKYEWADAKNGKGVIYRMIDEKRNDCPYDFKNILFYNDKFTSYMTSNKYYYTFSYVVSGKLYDGTVDKQVSTCYSNSMDANCRSKKKFLNNNVFRNKFFSSSCYSNTFGNSCYNNTFGNSCHGNSFEDSCYNNTFKDNCGSNNFGNSCSSNNFGNSCYSNTFGDDCGSNTFGNSCSSNTFGNSCYGNTFGYDCGSNIVGSGVTGNRFRSGTYRGKRDQYKTSITLNDEYYDDGSGQLVPIKHPDLSTQPSILPYKFIGQYVYEQLIPVTKEETSNTLWIPLNDICVTTLPTFLSINVVMELLDNNGIVQAFCEVPLSSIQYHSDNIIVAYKEVAGEIFSKSGKGYARIVYTSMPEESGDYYGYNNY